MTVTTHWENVLTSFSLEFGNEEKSMVGHVARQGETGQRHLDPLGFALTGHLAIDVASLSLQDEEAGLNDDRRDPAEGVAVSQTLYSRL